MRVYSRKRSRSQSVGRMANPPPDPTMEVMNLLRELARNQIQINDTQRLMEETLRKLAESKVSAEQSDNSVSGRTNNQPARSRPSMPTFPARTEERRGESPNFQEIQDQLREDWRNANLEGDISYKDYADLRMRYTGGVRYGNYNDELRRKMSKVNLSSFDGSGSISARAWVQKADTYFQLNPMPEDEAIKFAALHLEGIAHEWWHHGMVTLGHDQISSYAEFTERLIDRFDGKDPELNFKELAQLKQSGTVDNYITEFQRLSVLVTDLSERRLVVLAAC